MKLLLWLPLFALSACVANQPPHPAAPLSEQKIIQNFQIPQDRGRIVFYLGELIGTFNVDLGVPMDISVDGKNIGNIGRQSDLIAADLPPGLHMLKANSAREDYKTTSTTLELNVSAGKCYFLKVNSKDARTTSEIAVAAFVPFAGGNMHFETWLEQDVDSKGREEVANRTLVKYHIENIDPTSSVKPQNMALPVTPRAPSTRSLSQVDLEYKMEKIKSMYDKGLITKSEYDNKRKELLNSL